MPEKEGFIKSVVESFKKTHKEIDATTEELDARYRWLKYFVEEVLGYSGNDYHIEKNRTDITIFDDQRRPVIKIETKRPLPLKRESVEKQALDYAEPATKYVCATNFIKFWLWEKKNGEFTLKVELDFDTILKNIKTKFNIDLISSSDKGNILYLENLKKEFIFSPDKYQNFNDYYAQIDISEEKGFKELLKQLTRIVKELLMSFALRTFDKYYYAYTQFNSKIKEIDKKIKQATQKDIIQSLEREKERLKQEYSDYKDFGFEAWVSYSGRDPSKFEENKEVFCKETIYVLLNKLLFVRICEDKGLFKKKKISNGGIEQLREFIEHSGDQYKQIMNLAFRDAKHIYYHFYEPGVLDWYTARDGELDRVLNLVLWLLNQFDFQKVNRDILGNLYEKYLPKEERKALGEFYTPNEIIEYILDATEYKTKEDILDKDIIDPACGSGGFVVKAINRYIDKYVYKLGKKDRNQLTSAEAKLVIESAIEHIYGLDINPFACHIAEMNLLFQVIDLFEIIRKSNSEYKLPRFKIYQTDSLRLPLNQTDLIAFTSGKLETYAKEQKDVDSIKNRKFDFVVGNPPYVRIQFLPLDTVTYWKENYKVAHKRVDIYVPFYERAIRFLKERGKLGFITSDQFLVREYGLELRRFLTQSLNIFQIIDFKDVEVFPDITIYTLIFVAEKSDKRGKFLCVTAKRKQEKFLESVKENQNKRKLSHRAYELFRFDQNDLSEKNWNLVPPDYKEILEKLSEIKSGDLGNEDIADVLTGTYGGFDNCFMVKIIEEEKAGLVKIRNQDKKEYIVEKDILAKIFRGKDVKKWANHWKGWYIFYPYFEKNGKTICLNEEELKRKFPNAYSYFKLYFLELNNRMDSRKKISELGRPWFSLNRPGIFRMEKEIKIMTPCVTNKNNFSLDEEHHLWVVGTNYGIFPKKLNHKFLLGLLNSSLIEFYLKNVAPVKAGGFYQYMGNILKSIPIKIPLTKTEKEIEKKIIQVVDEILTYTKKGSEQKDIIRNLKGILNKFGVVPLIKCPLIEMVSIKSDEISEVKKKGNKLFINSSDFIETRNAEVITYLKKYIQINNLKKEHKNIQKIINNIPIPKTEKELSSLLGEIAKLEQEAKRTPNKIEKLEEKLNKLVADLYGLTKFEFTVITRFIEES